MSEPPSPVTAAAAAPAVVASTGMTTLIVVLSLLALAVVMILVAVWLVRTTRRDPAALGPLEVMADRTWRKADPDGRTQLLSSARPAGAPAPCPVIGYEPVAAEDTASDGAGPLGAGDVEPDGGALALDADATGADAGDAAADGGDLPPDASVDPAAARLEAAGAADVADVVPATDQRSDTVDAAAAEEDPTGERQYAQDDG